MNTMQRISSQEFRVLGIVSFTGFITQTYHV